MFVTKKKLNERTNEIVRRFDKLEKRSNCGHEEIIFTRDTIACGVGYNFRKECAICGKILKKYNCRLDWYAEKLSSDYKILKEEYDKMMEKKKELK